MTAVRMSPMQMKVREVIRDYRVTLLTGPIRCAKTCSGLRWWMLYNSENFGGCDFAIAVRTDRQWANPIKSELDKWLGTTVPLIRRQSWWEFPGKNGAQNRLHRVIGSDAGSAEKIFGMTLAGAFIDEFPKQPEDFVSILHGRCSVPGAKIVMTANPEGPLHWAKTDWVDKVEENGYGHLHFKLKDNPTLDEEYLTAIRKQFSGVLEKRMLDGEWAAATGMIYPLFDTAVKSKPRNLRVSQYIVSVDVATATVTHALLAAITPGRIWVIDEWRHDGSVDGQMKEEAQVRSIIRRWQGIRISKWIIDPAANDFQLILKQMGQVTKHGINDVLPGIQVVNMWINDGRLGIDRKCRALIREGGSYIWDEKAAERSDDKPVKGKDHGMDALRYLVATQVARGAKLRRSRYIKGR